MKATDYSLTRTRERIVREALRTWGIESVCEAVRIFRHHPAFAFNRGEDERSNGRRFDGLAEYILTDKGKLNTIETRIEAIFRHAGQKERSRA